MKHMCALQEIGPLIQRSAAMLESLPWYLELPGWYGMVVFPLAYALMSYKIIDRGYGYQILNLTGSVGFGFTGYMHGYVQSVFLEIVWGFIALTAMIKLAREARKSLAAFDVV